MAQASFNTKNPTIKRILKEAQELSRSPSPDYHAAPLETNLFEWHFTLRGPPAPSPFADGLYHGRIVLPPTYPLRPPSFRFMTPSGRFEVNREICLSISGHHEESWQPAWGLRTALVALRSFMETDPKGQVGGIETSKEVRTRLAGESKSFRCPGCGGQSNEEVIQAVEEASKENESQEGGEESSDGGKNNEIVVPAQLKLGYRDELQGGQASITGDAAIRPESKSSGDAPAHLPRRSNTIGGSTLDQVGRMTSDAATMNVPLRRSTIDTASLTLSNATPSSPSSSQRNSSRSQAQIHAAPPWLDAVIVMFAIALASLLLRKFLAD